MNSQCLSTRKSQCYWKSMFYESKNIDTWDYQWTFSIWENNGISILPLANLVKNIGFGINATNTKTEIPLYKNALYDALNSNLNNTQTSIIPNCDFDMQTSNNSFNIPCAMSPLTGSDNVRLIESITTSKIFSTKFPYPTFAPHPQKFARI